MDKPLIYKAITISLNDKTRVSLFFKSNFWLLEKFSGEKQVGKVCFIKGK